MLSFKPTFSLSSFTFIKELFSSSSLSTIRVVSSAYLRKTENAVLKLSIQKTKIMASGPVTSWEIDGETVETVADFIFLGSKITADGDRSHEIKRHSLEGKL